MSTFTIFPNFCFTVEANNPEEAEQIAFEMLKAAYDLTDGGFDFDIEKNTDD
ncbi:MAG: hypothetical protein HQL69_02460 [Magnetococcales bacterium]|nr:hypothetical protein [Magnetococcales bacterium]